VPNITYTQSNPDGTSDTPSFTYHAMEVCLGKDYELLPHPTEPPQNASADGVPYEAFGNANDQNSPDWAYYTGTDTYFDGHNSSESPLDSRQDGRATSLPIQGLSEGFAAPLSVPLGLADSHAVGDITWSGGNAQSQLTLTINGDPQPSPSTFNFTLPWREATDCPIPALPPPG
jgi:hypothetical protein